MENIQKILKLKQYIENSNNIVFFGGAGVSTESGIPDFRSKDGLYNQKYKYPPEKILSHSFFENNTKDFFEFYKSKLNSLKYKPNITHEYLQKLEDAKKLKAIITQNIDGLHQMAGSKNVLELHGCVLRNYCVNCNKFYDATYIFNTNADIPICQCGGIIKPDVVLYEENLNENIVSLATKAIANADMLIIGGTSLSVFPASSLIYYFKGKHLVLINKTPTIYDTNVSLLINDTLGNVFSRI